MGKNKGINGTDLRLRVPTLMNEYYPPHGHQFMVTQKHEVKRQDVDVRYDPQTGDFLGDDVTWNNGSYDLPISMIKKDAGNFYEVLTAGLYGGEMGIWFSLADELVEHRVPETPILFDDPSGFTIEVVKENVARPDVYNQPERRFRDSKACSTGRDLPIKDRQVELYRQLLNEMPSHRLDYIVYLHGIREIGSFKGSPDDLRKSLAKETYCGIVLPFSIIENLHSRTEDNRLPNEHMDKLVYRFNRPETTKPPYTSISPVTLKRFMFKDDFNHMLGIMGLPEDRYEWRVEGGPLGFEVEGHKLGYFPMITISEKKVEEEDIPF